MALTPQQVNDARKQLRIASPQNKPISTDWSAPDAFNVEKTQAPEPTDQPHNIVDTAGQYAQNFWKNSMDTANNFMGDWDYAKKLMTPPKNEGEVASKLSQTPLAAGRFTSDALRTIANPFISLGQTVVPDSIMKNHPILRAGAQGTVAGSPLGASGMAFGGGLGLVLSTAETIMQHPEIKQYLDEHPETRKNIEAAINIGAAYVGSKAIKPPTETPFNEKFYSEDHINNRLSDIVGNKENSLPNELINTYPEIANKILKSVTGEKITSIDQLESKIKSVLNPQEQKIATGDIDRTISDMRHTLSQSQELGMSSKDSSPAPDIFGGIKNTIENVGDGSKNILSAARDYITPLEENVKKVLTTGNPHELESKLNTLLEQAKIAKSTTGAPTPFEITGKEMLGGALKYLNSKLSELGTQKDKIIKEIDTVTKTPQESPSKTGKGTYGFDTSMVNSNLQGVINSFSKGLRGVVGKLGLRISKDGEVGNKPGIISEIPKNSADIKTLTQVNDIITQLKKNPTFSNIDKAIDATQELIYKRRGTIGAEPINAKLQGLLKQQIGKLNNELKGFASNFSELGDYAKVNEDYAKLNELYGHLNSKLGKNMSKAGSTIAQIFSKTDAGTKDFVQKLEQETGLPIFQNATLSKFVMDIVKDPRARSLLEGKGLPPISKGGMISRLMDYIEGKIVDPEQKARNILEEQKNK